MKIATFNVNSIRRRLPIVLDWLKRQRPDVLCLQETKVQDAEFPLDDLNKTGFHVFFRGMKGYNGVALLSRYRPDSVSFGFTPRDQREAPRIMTTVIDGITIVNTYVPQGFEIDSPKYEYKLNWFKRLRAYFATRFSPSQRMIWCGDMNVAPAPIDVHSPEKHLDHVCFHEAARRAYQRTVAWGFEDVFRRLHPTRQQFTFWDYRRPDAVEANRGWRIDHILATPALAARCQAAGVDVKPRLAPHPSDHTILWAKFSL